MYKYNPEHDFTLLRYLVDEVYQNTNTELYLYSKDFGAVQGLCSNHKLWATNIQYFNDDSEIRYGRSVFVKSLTDLLKLEADPFIQKFYTDLIEEINKPKIFDIYAACFSRLRDNAKQWVQYGDNGNGYCFKFDRRELGFNFAPLMRTFDIIYKPDLQTKASTKIILYLRNFVYNEKRNLSDTVNYSNFLDKAKNYALFVIPLLKKDEWSPEAEYRLFFPRKEINLLKLNVKKRNGNPPKPIIPYVEVPFAHFSISYNQTLPIEEIIIGNKLDFSKEKNRIIALFNGQPIKKIPKITKSKTSLR